MKPKFNIGDSFRVGKYTFDIIQIEEHGGGGRVRPSFTYNCSVHYLNSATSVLKTRYHEDNIIHNIGSDGWVHIPAKRVARGLLRFKRV